MTPPDRDSGAPASARRDNASSDDPAQAGKSAWQKFRDFRTPWWVDGLVLLAIAVLAWFVSAAVGEVQEDPWARWGLLSTSWGLVLSLGTRDWKCLRTITYYGGLLLGVVGLGSAMFGLYSSL